MSRAAVPCAGDPDDLVDGARRDRVHVIGGEGFAGTRAAKPRAAEVHSMNAASIGALETSGASAEGVTNGHKTGASATARQIHDDVEGALRLRAHSSTARRLKSAGTALWRSTKRHPFLASAALGVAGASLAAAVGVAEITFAAALAFAGYKVLREGEPPLQALEDVERAATGEALARSPG